MIQPGVSRKITLDLKLLAAILAGVAITLSVFSHEVRSKRFFSRADEITDEANEFAFLLLILFVPCPVLVVFLSYMSDRRRSFVASKVALYAARLLFIFRQYVPDIDYRFYFTQFVFLFFVS